MKIFIDTWGWISLLNKREYRHEEVKKYYTEMRKKGCEFFTTNDILNETYTLLFRRVPIQKALFSIDNIDKAIEHGYLNLIWIDEARFNEAKSLRRKYIDKPYLSFTDITSIVIINEFAISDVLTEDDHFMQVGIGIQKVP